MQEITLKMASKVVKDSLIQFLAKLFTFFLIWQTIYDLYLSSNGALDNFLSLSVVYLSKFTLSSLGWDIYSSDRLLYINGYKSVEILNGCNALNLMILFSSFIICLEGKLLKKFQFLIMGIIIIYVLNILRIISFSLATVYFQEYWSIFHEISPFIFFYPVILWLWYKWTVYNQINNYLIPEYRL